MRVKFLGIILVVFSGIYMGYCIRKRYRDRERNLGYMIVALQNMKAHINFCADCLTEIFEKLASLPAGKVCDVFFSASELSKDMPPQKAFYEAVKLSQKALCFSKEDMYVVKSFCATLGKGDAESEKEKIDKTIMSLSALRENAGQALQKEGKLAGSFCVMSSILLSILFF